MDSATGTASLLPGQTSIDDVLKEQYDLTPQLPLRWAAPGSSQRLYPARDAAGAPPSAPTAGGVNDRA
jgi:hypothetical protein|uniref:Uncharacterized protein n=2 Tax=unclassified Arthrobacter TaxID=235627 RepID=I3W181_9MICC|nr:hypothetical protein [Arthrobacter sp. J3.40]AFK89610.1 hypothetical protein [Arthrobacter sp. J3.53]